VSALASRPHDARSAVVAEALSWLGTPYHHHGRIKGAGVDCAQILLAVYVDALQLAPPLDPGLYPTQWHLHRSEEMYVRWLQAAGARPVQAPAPGDITLYRFGRTFSHAAICIHALPEPDYVHAYVNLGVIRTRASEEPLAGRLCQHWSVLL
jgi:cell wall-associated NlpC family hydrolase